jgi:hypothetical protein
MARKRKKISFFNHNVRCHLCGFPIPDDVVDPGHGLFGTIDHLLPRSLGGTDRAEDRAPCHLRCNGLRGARPITPQLIEQCREAVLDVFEQSRHLILSNIVVAKALCKRAKRREIASKRDAHASEEDTNGDRTLHGT